MKNLNSLDRSNCIKVLISPDKNGFVCAIEQEINNKLKAEEKELVQTIARGLIFQAQNDPHATFMMGVIWYFCGTFWLRFGTFGILYFLCTILVPSGTSLVIAGNFGHM